MLKKFWIACLMMPMMLFGWESSNRFSVIGTFQDGSKSLGADWALDIQHEEYLGRLLLQAGYSLHSELQNDWAEKYSLEMDARTYRWWLSMQLKQSEVRLGLQQINFGPAQVLRPLRWFDSLNPQDAYQISRGVDALLFRHYWLNNANLWMWGILGDAESKGNEFIGSKESSIEYGGRIQYPSPLGELALSIHLREIPRANEYRMGLDYRYDGALGAWLEASASGFDNAGIYIPDYSTSACLGMDYVLMWGNGLAITMENMLLAQAPQKLGELRTESFSTAWMLNYPVSLLDTISLLAHKQWQGDSFGISAQLRRVYDYFSFELNLGHTSEQDYLLNIMVSLNI